MLRITAGGALLCVTVSGSGSEPCGTAKRNHPQLLLLSFGAKTTRFCTMAHPGRSARFSLHLPQQHQQFSFWFLWLGCWLGERRASRRSGPAVTVEEAAVLQRRG